MTELNQKNNKSPASAGKNAGSGFDAATNALSAALGISFAILKVIMVVLVIVFLASGFKMVEPDEQAIVLRFGKIRGIGENRILGPGLHWVLPYPVDETIKFPVEKKTTLPINSFWYFQTKEEMLENPQSPVWPDQPLRPEIDGYCITRSEKQDQAVIGGSGSDYNIIHGKWQLTYKIDDPERFFKNVYINNVKPGENYAQVIEKSVTPLLEYLTSDAVVNTMVYYTIDEALSSQDRIPKQVTKLMQEKLDKIESGISVVSVLLTDITWPRQVDSAFQNSIKASQRSQTVINEAKIYSENSLNEVAGPVAGELLAALKNKNISDDEKQNSPLWVQLAGSSQETIAHARAYRTKVVEIAKANAEYLRKILPEYRKHPKLVVQKIYQDTMEYVLNDADEKMIIPPTQDAKSREIRILLNRDPAIKQKSENQK
jgi:modulator of FtsH protease HflK